MLGFLIPIAIAVFVWRSSQKKEMTAAQKSVLDKALSSKNPEAIQKVAVAFGREGFAEAHKRLCKRASLAVREPAEVMLCCEAFRNALLDPSGSGTTQRTRLVAKALKGKEMTESAKFLEEFARGFERARSIPPVLLRPNGNPESGDLPEQQADPMSVAPNTFQSEEAEKEPRDPDLPEGQEPGELPIDYPPIADEDLPPMPMDEGGTY